ncbi:MAG: hypothetical protein J6X44_08680, partial [Thermoguttaceae bacterium]|nr:hypothetical protein [Thermoguttaceae bacterium]
GDYGASQLIGAVTINGDATVSGNKATGSYGAIYAGSAFSVQGAAKITDNEALDGQVGAAYVKGNFSADSLRLENNKAATNYGAMNVGGEFSVANDAYIADNEAVGDYGAFASAKKATFGGFVTIDSNKAGGNYGAFRAASFSATNPEAVVLITNNQTNGNYGAGAVTDAGVAFEVAGKAVVTGNKAGLAEIVVVGDPVETTGENGERIVTTTTTTTVSGQYGALAATNGSIKIVGDAEISYNSAARYGAIYAKNDVEFGGALNMVGNEANGKVVTKVDVMTTVDVIDEETGEVVGTRTEPETNETVAYDGADYGAAYAGTTFTVVGEANVEANKAAGKYGAIYAGGDASFGALTLVGNESGSDVGGVYAKTNMTVSGPLTATGNKAGGKYGAAYVGGDLNVAGDAAVSNNEADFVSGIYGVKAIVIDGSLTADANKAAQASAAIQASGAATIAGDAKIVNNVNGGVKANSVDIGGSLEATNNQTSADGAVIYSNASVNVAGDATISGNKAENMGGAIYAKTAVAITGKATITNNTANVGGAIYAGSVDLNNSLVVDNEATEKGGAIYAKTIKLVNVTVAGNKAFEGGALYVLTSAAIDNSIVAGNSVTSKEETIVYDEETSETITIPGTGVDVFVAKGGNVALRNSLLQNVESTGEVAFSDAWMNAAYRCFVNVDPMFVNAAGGDYSLQAGSPAINGGANKLAVAGVDTDLAGATRIVGIEVGGDIYAIDMGAYEYQEVISPDLAFGDNPVNFWFAKIDGQTRPHYIAGQDVVLDYTIMNLGDAPVFDKFNVTFAVSGVTATGENYYAVTVGRYKTESDFFDWLKSSDWLGVGASQDYARQNLGALPVGSYEVTISLDADSEIAELVPENNVFTAEFQVFEAPNLVVTTDADGAFDPLDDKITLREASELYVGPYWFGSRVLIDSGEFVRDDMVVVKVEDGVASTGRNVLSIDGTDVDLVDGQTFEFGRTYIVFDNGVFTYPNGEVVAYAPGKFDYDYSITLTLEDGSTVSAHRESKFDYLESIGQVPPVSSKYEYVDVVEKADGTKVLLTDLQPDSIPFAKTFATYHAQVAQTSTGEIVDFANGAKIVYDGVSGEFLNGAFVADDGSVKVVLPDRANVQIVGEEVNTPATYLEAVFTLEDGSIIEFVDGATVTTDLGVTGEMAIRRDAVSAAFETVDGMRYEFANDGSAWVYTFVDNVITFSDALVAAKATIVLDGTAITPAKDQTIEGAAITVDANELSRAMSVLYGRSVVIDDMSFVNGLETKGGAIHNAGSLELNNVSVTNSTAYTEDQVDPNDKILLDGFGGAIYNSGTLSINGGSYSGNEAAYFGGAIYSIGAIVIADAEFASNASSYFGGAIYFQNSNASITSAIFRKNEAKYNGGAIAAAATNAAANLTVVNSLLVENKS